jgi:hypothetical protein
MLRYGYLRRYKLRHPTQQQQQQPALDQGVLLQLVLRSVLLQQQRQQHQSLSKQQGCWVSLRRVLLLQRLPRLRCCLAAVLLLMWCRC